MSQGFGEHPLRQFLHQAGVLGERQELHWGHQAEGGVGPANERLHGEDLTRSEVQLGLIVKDEISIVNRDAQLFDQIELLLGAVDHLVVKDVGDVAQLRAVHRRVGAPREPDGFGGVRRGQGDADAGADAGLHLLQNERLADLLQDVLSDGFGDAGVRVNQDHGEFVAAQTKDRSGGGYGPAYPRTQLA